jgi:LuxR family maltose regulon positive regulatory protein
MPQVKLGMPVLRADYLDRTELLAELAAGATTLVCAPPGNRKTLPLTDWATRPPPVETAWVTIDGGDNDPRRLWARPRGPRRPQPTAASRSVPSSVKSSLLWSTAEHMSLSPPVDDLHFLPNPIRLILDDVDELTDPEVLRDCRSSRATFRARSISCCPAGSIRRSVDRLRRSASSARSGPTPALHVGRIGDAGWQGPGRV